MTTPISRLGLRNKPGPKPEWKWDKKHGKLERCEGNGIDWWRYCKKVVVPKLIPFVQECEMNRPGMIIQEDGAAPHHSAYKERLYNLYNVIYLLWVGNSPGLNMIAPCWPHMKRTTTRKKPAVNRAEAERAWVKAWKELEQWCIQQWIERIPRHIEEIIKLEGDNNYREGKSEKVRRFKEPLET